MNKQHGFSSIILIIGVFVVLAGTVGYFVLVKKSVPVMQQTPKNQSAPVPQSESDETINWETYQSDKYGFEFKYPSEIIFASIDERGYEYTNPSRGIFVTKKREVGVRPTAFSSEFTCNVVSQIVKNEDNSSLEELEEQEDSRISYLAFANGETIYIATTTTKFDGTLGILMELTAESKSTPFGTITIVPLLDKNFYVHLYLERCDANVVRKILSTFKLTQ